MLIKVSNDMVNSIQIQDESVFRQIAEIHEFTVNVIFYYTYVMSVTCIFM